MLEEVHNLKHSFTRVVRWYTYLHAKKLFGYILEAFGWKMFVNLVYFTATWNTFWSFGIFCGHFGILFAFWYFFGHLVCCSKKNCFRNEVAAMYFRRQEWQENFRIHFRFRLHAGGPLTHFHILPGANPTHNRELLCQRCKNLQR
jgi:hypothetical protein